MEQILLKLQSLKSRRTAMRLGFAEAEDRILDELIEVVGLMAIEMEKRQ